MYTIISSIISAVTAIFVCLLSQIGMSRKQAMQMEKQTALIELRLSQLAEKVEKHNNVIERTFRLEESCKLFEEKFKVANHRLDDLEKSMGK